MTRHHWDGAGSPRRYDLGETDDPAGLIPGSPRDLHDYAEELRDDSATHRVIATTLREIPVGQVWAGEAADGFVGAAVALVRRYDDSAEAHGLAARTVENYADGLVGAQRKAGEAIDLYGSTTSHARADRDTTRSSNHGGARRDEARRLLDRARADLATLAQDAQVQIRRARETLPAATPLLNPTDGGGSPHTAPASHDTSSAPPGGRTVTVRPGDTLSGIAERFLGDASRWPEIARLNRDVIENPDLIFPGQRLVLPAAGGDDPPERDSDDDRDDRGPHESDRCDPPRDDRHDDDRHDDDQLDEDRAPRDSQDDDQLDEDRAPRDSQDDDRYPNEPAPPSDPDRSPERPDAPPPPSTPAPSPTPTPTPAPTPTHSPAPTPTPSPAPTSPDGSATPAPPAPTPPPPTPAPSPAPLPDFYPEPAPREPDIYDLPDSPPPTSTDPVPVPEQPAPPPADPEPPPTTGPTTPPPVDPPTTETTPAPARPDPPTTDPGTPTAPDGADPNSGDPTPDPPDEPDPRSGPSLVANDGEDPGAIDLGTGLFVVGAVGAVAAGAVLLARRSGTAADRPATGAGADVAGRRRSLPPVVRQLGNAYLRARRLDAPPTAAATSPRPPVVGAPTPPASHRARFALPIGRTTDGGPAHIDLATHPALALHGDRLADITRAILLTCLSPPTGQPSAGPPAHVVIPAADAADLLDDLPSLPTPPGLHIVDDIDTAIDELERWPRAQASPPLVLIATAPPAQSDPAERLQQILTARRRRVAAVLLGDWPTPATVHATPAAAVHGNTAFPTLPIGTRLFTTSLPNARDLLATLTAPHPSTDQPDTDTDRAGPDHAEPADPPTIPIPIAGPANTGDDQHEDAETNAPPPKPAPDDNDNPDPADPEPDRGDDTTNTTTPEAAADQAPTEPQTRTSSKALTIEVFGRLRVNVNQDGASAEITSEISDRRRELLTYLAVHPDGAHRDRMITDLWTDSTADNPPDLLGRAIRRLRDALAPHTNRAIVLGPEDGHYRLHPNLTDVDYWRFESASTGYHTGHTESERADAARQSIKIYQAELAPALTADWIEPFRARATRTAIGAAEFLARHLYHSGEIDQAIGVLEHATKVIDPRAESLYQLLIQIQRKHGRPKAAERALGALTARLAEIDETPSQATLDLLDQQSDPIATPEAASG
jgi:DNA-binding SARP family transcriptional activator/LysM repeat protein